MTVNRNKVQVSKYLLYSQLELCATPLREVPKYLLRLYKCWRKKILKSSSCEISVRLVTEEMICILTEICENVQAGSETKIFWFMQKTTQILELKGLVLECI